MAYALVKSVARRLGLYRQARWFNRHVLDRAELRQFRAECALYAPFLRPGDLCFDVGANFGAKTEVFLALGARVVAFEPQPDCSAENRARNPRATVIESAVGRSSGRLRLYVDPHRTGSSLLPDWRSTSEDMLEVSVTTLDVAVGEHGVPAFCKIDVEGFELDVLHGLSHRVPVLSYEYHAHRIPQAVACLKHLAQRGSVEVNLTPNDQPVFVFATWLDLTAACQFLENEVPKNPAYGWGDVFVREQHRS